MTIKEVVSNIDNLNEEAVVYAKKTDGKFLSSSEVMLLHLDEEDLDLPVQDVSEKYCPGYSYFLECSIIKELVEDMSDSNGSKTAEQQVARIIQYADLDR